MSPVNESSIVTTSRREAIVALLIFVCATAYSAGYCTWKGYYGSTTEELTFVFGFPAWVFWGVIVPWSACTVVSWWYAFVFMTDEDLEEPAAAPTGDSETEGVEHV